MYNNNIIIILEESFKVNNVKEEFRLYLSFLFFSIYI